MTKYSIGLDFGTLSGRAVLVNLENGEEAAESIYEYPHAVMTESLHGKVPLEDDWALQDPKDYLEVLSHTIPDVLRKSGVRPEDVTGVGVDFTSCTILPVLSDGTPLCFKEEYKNCPHAYVKLWKHNAAQKQADKINSLGEKWLKRYGGKTSAQWTFAKILQVLEENEEIYRKADRFIEAADWIVWQLTGKERRSSCTAGYKALWSKKDGYPGKEFFKKLNPKMENVIEEKITTDVLPVGSKAGEINGYAARLTGLKEGTAVAAGVIDAHAAVPAVGIDGPGKMLLILGTSACHIIMGKEEREVPGICGVAEDGVLPGLFGYEAGQSCVGDMFAWFIKNCVPESYMREAEGKNMNIHELLREKAQKLKVGESGLLALDWWDGNRSTLVDTDLAGLILGLNLRTKPEEIYRALIEAAAYGTKIIIDTYEENGIEINEIRAAGGIAEKDSMMMQIYADVTNREIKISGSPQASALGSAIYGAYAGGYFETVSKAIEVMGKLKDTVYRPCAEDSRKYDEIYREYKRLYDYFGKENSVMKRLKSLK
ncbi:MAG: ribulokinase [Clostridia bacterium]|nr:ribulokinase [Clostridia bacterium]